MILTARKALYRVTAILHTENHDPVTNGELRVLRCLGATSTCLFDVGANVGTWARLASEACPRASVHCFEIASPVRDALCRRMAGTARITVAGAGLLDYEGSARVKYYRDETTLTSVVDFPHRNESVWRTERVTTGDAYLEAAGIERIDLLKVDGEGSDLQVIRGFGRALKAGRVSAVQFEYGYAGILTGGLLRAFYEVLEPLGFVIGRVLPSSIAFGPYRLTDERFFGPNFLAVRRSRSDLLERLAP